MQSEEEKNLRDLQDQQLQSIKNDIESIDDQLISNLQSFQYLYSEFENHAVYLQKIQIIQSKYKQMRRVRRDGSCFYRSYLYGLLEKCCTDDSFRQQLESKVTNSKQDMEKAGFDAVIIEDFMEVLLDNIKKTSQKNAIDLVNDKFTSDYMVMFLRMITTTSLKNNSFLYEPFLEMPIDMFCQKEVDPIDKEADQIQILGLVNYLQIPVNIVYMDSGAQQSGDINEIRLPEDFTEQCIFINLLYRPGHYELLYK